MNYERIAELVHKLVKNPKSLLTGELRLPSAELKMNELTTIQSVFSEFEVSGDVLTFRITPLDFWV